MMNYPLVVYVISFFALTFSGYIGKAAFKNRSGSESAVTDDFRIIQSATLAMLGIIIGFSFSMASTRYDQRKSCEETEANAIGTEYLRADLLPAADAAKVKALLVAYVDQRVLFFTFRSDQELRVCNLQTEKLKSGLWAAVIAADKTQPGTAILTVGGMNDVIDSQGFSQAAMWNRMPTGAWALMGGIALLSNVLVGVGMRNADRRLSLLQVLPLVVSIAFFLIAEIDSPRTGVIRVSPQNLISLSESVHGSAN